MASLGVSGGDGAGLGTGIAGGGLSLWQGMAGAMDGTALTAKRRRRCLVLPWRKYLCRLQSRDAQWRSVSPFSSPHSVLGAQHWRGICSAIDSEYMKDNSAAESMRQQENGPGTRGRKPGSLS